MRPMAAVVTAVRFEKEYASANMQAGIIAGLHVHVVIQNFATALPALQQSRSPS